MGVIRIKPHTLEVLRQRAGYEDANGDYHAGGSDWEEVSECDIVPAGMANRITLPDGTDIRYSYTIFLPSAKYHFLVGEHVRIRFWGRDTQEERREFVVRGYHSYQHQAKIWV